MRKELLDELMIISEEEKKYKSGQSTVEQSLYAKDNLTEIDRKRLLQRGKLITVSAPPDGRPESGTPPPAGARPWRGRRPGCTADRGCSPRAGRPWNFQ